jgi:pimeloyl-ACP methyl ester carboxylesterase
LLHGGGKDLNSWREFGFAEGLRNDYRLVLIDERGCGKSGKPIDSELYNTEYRVGDVTAVLDDLNVKSAHLLGYSYGGRIAMECAKVVPLRVVSLIIGGMGPQGKSSDGSNPVLKLLEANP